ncbi:MAG: tetraacyldisaccharide 4'-kinase [Acidobacteriota bacterium]
MSSRRWTKLAEPLFRTGVRIRHEFYRRHLFRTRWLNHPVISIGNLSVGGTGKSPLVRYFAGFLQEAGMAPAILSRGYRGTSESTNRLISDGNELLATPAEAGDEAWMLARILTGVPVAVGRRRWVSGRLIERLNPHPDRVFLLDDGFQHLGLARDLDLVVCDATRPLQGESLLPAGRLRESPRALSRADGILLTRCHLAEARLAKIEEEIELLAPEAPRFLFRTEAVALRDLGGQRTEEPSARAGCKGVVLAALGNPDQFVKDVALAGVKVVNEFLFRDHHPYTQEELDVVIERAHRLGAEFVVTTEKDVVRLEGLSFRGLPFLALDIRYRPAEPEKLHPWLLDRIRETRERLHPSSGGRGMKQ